MLINHVNLVHGIITFYCPLIAVDYEKNDCSRSYTVNDADIFRLEAYPRLDVSSGRDRCFNQFVGSNGKKLKIYVSEVKVGSCGIFVQIYDGDEKMLNDPRVCLHHVKLGLCVGSLK